MLENIEAVKVKILKTLKAGKKIWLEGEVLDSPLPTEILLEVKLRRGTVLVLSGNVPPLPEIKHVDYESKVKLKTPDLSTATTIKMRQELEQKEKKRKSKLIKRKKPITNRKK